MLGLGVTADGQWEIKEDFRPGDPGLVWLDAAPRGAEELELILGDLGLSGELVDTLRQGNAKARMRRYGTQYLFHLQGVGEVKKDALEIWEMYAIVQGDGIITLRQGGGGIFRGAMERLVSWASPAKNPGLPFYALSVHLLDRFFPAVDTFHAALGQVEQDIIQEPHREILRRIFALKKRAIALERVLHSHRHILHYCLRRDSFLGDETRPLFEDVYDELSLAFESVDTYHELLSSAQEAYLGTLSNRTNEVMKTLTIMATITAPLTVVTGIYGMNFNIPETHWANGYIYSLLLMFLLSVFLLLFFRWRRWI